MTDDKICRNDGRCEYAIQSGAETEGSCPSGKCAMPCDNSAAHLTIPGALEWDGDNSTHGADGESRSHGEQEISDDDLLKMAEKAFGQVVDYDLLGNPITDYRVLTIGAYGPAIRRLVSLARQHPVAPVSAYTAVDMTTAAAGGFRDGQAELYAVLNQAYMALIGYLPGHRNDLTDAAIAACSAILFPVEAGCAYEIGDWQCREGGYLWDAGTGEGWDPEDCTHICPHCRTKDYLESAKDDAESCSSYSNNGSSGTGLDIWTSSEKVALTANHPAACKALSEIGPVAALDGDDVVICNTQQVAP